MTTSAERTRKMKKSLSLSSDSDESFTTNSSLSSLDDSAEELTYANNCNTSTSHLTTSNNNSELDESGYSTNTSFTITTQSTSAGNKTGTSSIGPVPTKYHVPREPSPKKRSIPVNSGLSSSLNRSDVSKSSIPPNERKHHVHKHFHHYNDTLTSKISEPESLRSSYSGSKIAPPTNNRNDESISISSKPPRVGPPSISSTTSSSTTNSGSILNTSSPNLNVDLSTTTTNGSKAILSALQSLQDRIKLLNGKVDELEREKVEQRNAYEQALFNQKMKLESERDSLKDQLDQTRVESRRLSDRLQIVEKEYESCKEAKRDITVTNSKSQQRSQDLERKSSQMEKELVELKENHTRLTTMYEQSLNKIEELQSNLVKMHRRKERAETEKKELDVALKEMVDLHQHYVDQTMGNENTATVNEVEETPAAALVVPVSKSKKKGSSSGSASRPKSASCLQPTISSKRKKKEPIKRKVERTVAHYTTNPRPTSPVTNLFTQPPNVANVISKLTSNKSIHERLKRSNNNINPPFLPNNFKGESRTFHVAGQAQNLLSSVTGVPSKKEPSNNYYGGNEHNTDKEHVQLIKEVDAFNNGEDILECITQLESEYVHFQEQYKLYLKQMSEPECNIEFVKEQLKYLTEAIDRKHKQLTLLKNYQVNVCEKIRDATSPPRIRGTEKRVQALRLFNDLRRLQQQGTVANHC